MKLIVSMGIPAKNYNKLQEGFRYDGAIIQVIDWRKKKIVKEISYRSPPEHLGEGLSMQFKGATIYCDKYYVVTNTEVLRYDLETWKLERVISHPSFNDLHGIMVTENFLYVCNTGLEMIQVIDGEGEVIDEINLASVPTWERFDKKKDYRKVATTKPHEVHVNHIFSLNGDLWATRPHKFDAVCLSGKKRRIKLSDDSGCHDGFIRDKHIYFTSVNGHIIVVDKHRFSIEEDIDVNKLTDKPLGWTRGLELIGNKAYLGTTSIRESKFKEYAKWILTHNGDRRIPSSILEIDLKKNRIVDFYKPSKYPNAAFYTILKHPE